MDCKKIQPNLSAFIDGELDHGRSQAVAAHLTVCAICEDELRQLRQVVHWTREVPEQEPPAALPTQILHAVALAGTRRPQPFWALLSALQLPRTFTWVACTSATAAVAVALAAHQTPMQSRAVRTAAVHEASAPSGVVTPFAPAPSASASAAAVPQAQPAAPTDAAPPVAAAPAPHAGAPAVAPAPAPSTPARPAAPASATPARSTPALNVTIEAPPVLTEAAPAPVTELKQAEPTAPVEMDPGPSMMALGAMNPGPDAPPAGVMGTITDMPKMMMTGTGNDPIPGDYGVEELRQFLQEQKNTPRVPRDPMRERNPG